MLGYQPYVCASEDEARKSVEALVKENKWPCYFFDSDTTGEKDFEEFYTKDEILDMSRFQDIGIIKNNQEVDLERLKKFQETITTLRKRGQWTKDELVDLFNYMLPDFAHKETGKYLDSRM